jgi:uncharacterized membrane protein
MKDDLEINLAQEKLKTSKKKSNVNKWGIIISLIFIVIGLLWYGVNLGLIPLQFLQEQAGPIALIIIGILILAASFKR